MRMKIAFTLLAVATLLAACATSMNSKPSAKLTYPVTKKGDLVETLHGTPVPDPYRWLEDDHAADTKAWVEEQNKVTFGYLEQIPARTNIKARLTKLWNYERYGTPSKHGGRYIFSKNDGLQNQSVLLHHEFAGRDTEVC